MPPDDPIARDGYDALADHYAEDVTSNCYNAEFEFPATTDLVPDVAGNRVLDAGCGTGLYTEWLLEEGAEVVGVDASEEMLAHAREAVGDRAELHSGNLAEPLEFADDGAFDGVVSALVLDYVEDWNRTFAEFHRVLRPGGFLVFSTNHPFDEFPLPDDADYHEVERGVHDWGVEIPYYRRPLEEIFDPLLEAGFRLDRVVEPQPTEEFRRQRPERYEKESRRPVFLCVRAFAPER